MVYDIRKTGRRGARTPCETRIVPAHDDPTCNEVCVPHYRLRRYSAHASTVPSAKRIAYSTCSVHAIENERVVRQALEAPEALEGRYKLAPREQVLPTWNRRGLNEEMGDPGTLCGMSLATVADAHRTSIDHAQSLIRCSPDEDRTNGFFVCLFVRRDEADATDATTAKKRQIEGESVEPSQSKRRKRRKKGASHTQTS